MKIQNSFAWLALCAAACAQENYKPSPQNLQARQKFEDSRFGLFIHWGVYSVLGKGEWVMNNDKMTIAEYEKVPPQFNPTEFDPVEWVRMAKDAGMRYITITSKHHDGFAMWHTKQSDWDIVDRTPYKKDALKMLADECHRQGLALFFYHSQLDWHNTDYYPRGRTGQSSGRPDSGDWDKYLQYMNNQLTELLTNYGPIAGIWFDGMWDKPKADWHLAETYGLIHRLQPAALVGSNHHVKPFPGEDFQMFEKDLPGKNTTGFSGESVISDLPLETCETISGAWGYNASDKKYKSTKDLIQYLVKAVGNNANFLLNVGPMPNGKIQPEFTARLHEVGEWLRANGDAIYGTRGGPITPRSWGVTTAKGNTVYVHLLDWPDDVIALPALPKAKSAHMLVGGAKVDVEQHGATTLLHLPSTARDPNDTVIAVEQ